MGTRRPLVANRDAALYGGAFLWFVGSVLLWDAYNNRGHDKPLVMRLAGVFL